MIKGSDATDDTKINLVAQAIAVAMGHSERWHQYRTVARMQVAGYAACQLIERTRRAPYGSSGHSQPLRKPRVHKPFKRVLTPKDDNDGMTLDDLI